jgi:hypothetical protein
MDAKDEAFASVLLLFRMFVLIISAPVFPRQARGGPFSPTSAPSKEQQFIPGIE